ncbi:MAG: NBR1-Ig-like domain-containing protein, partial [Deltaproteobacteria bacterium]
TATFAPTEMVTPTLEVKVTPTLEQVCNAADLVAASYQVNLDDSDSSGTGFTLALRLTNMGTCTWTTEYAVLLVGNNGLPLLETQYFSTTAVPGQTVDLLIDLTKPEDFEDFSPAWILQDPQGDVFGHGENADEWFVLNALIGDPGSRWIIPVERCTGEPGYSGLPRYARLMHDPQWMPWPSRMADPDWRAGFYYDWYPETVQLWTRPNGGDGRLPYSKEWLEYLRAIQPNDEAAVWIARVAAGLFNNGNDFIPILKLGRLKDEPIAESISSGGNVVKILEIKHQAGRIEMLYFKYPVPDSAQINYLTKPWLVTKFTSVSIDGKLGNAGGIDVYFPNLSKQTEGYWVDLQRVEFFPELPFCAKVQEDLKVMDGVSDKAEQIGVIAEGQEIVVRNYFLQGSDVWGRIWEGWVRLVFQIDGQPIYPTSWLMETRPPIVFTNSEDE